MMKISEWKHGLEHERENKDLFFKQHFQSPIPAGERAGFKGLDYYPPDPSLRFELALKEHKEKEKIKVQDTQGNERIFLRWGEFRFKIGGEKCALQAYKSSPMEERLFIPFRDATSGKETYGAGRYIDLEPEEDYRDGKWVLDFNNAYNPWCAYSKNYACPYIPPENRIKVPVRAGEKNYKKDA
ncbi:MAG: DUF1684 domain-containing protein [Anaerolineaceae bacterium]|nr:DUF1684 domain-containing protein [Anaerolineaceae bacterium]